MEMPYSLQSLPPEAVDILRYYSTANADTAHTESIMDGTGLTDRGFGKGIRRLVTRNYLAMSSDQVYRLTDHGKRVIEELKVYDADDSHSKPEPRSEERFVRRHLVLVAPRILPADKPVEVMLGFEEADDEEYLLEPVSMLVRLSVVNGEPRQPHEILFTLTNRLAQQSFEISAGHYTSVRLRVESCQLRNDGDDFDFCGGMFVDLPVSEEGSGHAAAAYGVDVILKEEQ